MKRKPSDRMAMDMADAIDALATMPMGIGAFGAPNMTCTEAELFADVLRAAGHEDQAERFLRDHAEGDDDPGDLHHGL